MKAPNRRLPSCSLSTTDRLVVPRVEEDARRWWGGVVGGFPVVAGWRGGPTGTTACGAAADLGGLLRQKCGQGWRGLRQIWGCASMEVEHRGNMRTCLMGIRDCILRALSFQ